MRDLLRGTWLATALFVVSVAAVNLLLGPAMAGIAGASALLVTPPIWWRLVARRGAVRPGRGAAAGSLCAAIIFVIPVLLEIVRAFVVHDVKGRRYDAYAQFGHAAALTLFTAEVILAIPLGAALGALAALLQKRWLGQRLS